ncbi:glycosyltransferase family 2 protein, partial [bacterium]|nr:glycosyltransferase family 2 protein [bacterium]
MARVSAVIPVYNGAATIARAVASVLAQRYDGAVETIVVDDGSTDSTRAILAGFGDHIRTIHQPNRGPAAARNVGARLAAGEYLAFLDADDEWMPEKLARTV